MITDESFTADRERRQRRNLRRSLRRQVEAAEERLIEARQVLAAESDPKARNEIEQAIIAAEQSIAEIHTLLGATNRPANPQPQGD